MEQTFKTYYRRKYIQFNVVLFVFVFKIWRSEMDHADVPLLNSTSREQHRLSKCTSILLRTELNRFEIRKEPTRLAALTGADPIMIPG